MQNTSILVLGAGELGMAVLRHLAKQAVRFPGTTITVLLRSSTINSNNPSKQRDIAELKSLGIDFLPGDLSATVHELSAIFKNFHTVISCTGFVTGAGGLQLKLTHAVLNAGVKRYFPWQFGVDYDIIGKGSAQDSFDEQLDVRNLLRSQNRTKWVIISTGMFTSFLFEPFFGVVNLAQNTVHALGSWNTAVTVTTPEDIGKLTAGIYFAEPAIEDSIVYTAGDTITYGQLADIIDAALDRKLKREDWSLAKLKSELMNDAGDIIKKYRVVFAEGKGVSWDFNKTFNAEQKIETMSVKQWVQDNLK